MGRAGMRFKYKGKYVVLYKDEYIQFLKSRGRKYDPANVKDSDLIEFAKTIY